MEEKFSIILLLKFILFKFGIIAVSDDKILSFDDSFFVE